MSLLPYLSGKQKRSSSASIKDADNENKDQQNEFRYRMWWSTDRLFEYLRGLPNDGVWIFMLSCMALAAIVWVAMRLNDFTVQFLDIIYNIFYAVHVLICVYSVLMQLEVSNVDLMTLFGFLLDILSYSYFIIVIDVVDRQYVKLVCYYLRLHRPFRYFWSSNNYNLKGSIVVTTLMYCYIFHVLRITWALIWLEIDEMEQGYSNDRGEQRALTEARNELAGGPLDMSTGANYDFLGALYVVNKMFIPIGPSIAPGNDLERITCLLIMMSGSFVVTGAAVASLSLTISIYMRPEETFRSRYRLIMREMKHSNIPLSLREKVETFYKMYWQKQRAVSTTELLPTFPPTLPITIYTDIYFKATQKSQILRDLSYQFLSEIVKSMHTIHYIPGDTIIKRSTKKHSIIYITYGDIEMLTAEDDSTAILRMTRGTILSPCGLCPVAGCARAHVEIRAATFCTAHELRAIDLWKAVVKHGRNNGQGAVILDSFNDHFDRVKRHYFYRVHNDVKYKSSILHFKRNLRHLQESKDENGDSLLSHTDVMLEIAGCYVMRNRIDSSLTEDADAICLRPTFPCILQPNSSLQVVWHSFVACLIFIVCITHPYYMVYKKEVPLKFRFFDYVVTAVYVLDLMVHLSTGTIVEDGTPITLLHTSSQQARSRWFLLDVLGTLPIFEFVGEGHFAGINKLLRLPKVFRVLKVVEEECVYYSNAIRFISFSLMIVIACYLMAALQQGFMCFQFGHCLVTNFTHSPFWENKPSDDETVPDRILFSLYWAISMITFTTHMDSWGTDNWKNMMYTMILLEICIVLHIFIEAVYSATIMVSTALRENFDASIETVKHFLARNDVDLQLRQRFLMYLQLCWYNDMAYSMSNKNKTIFNDLPPHVYQDIVTRQRSKFILCIPFMKLLHRDDLRNVSSNARMFYTSPNEILLNTGDITNEIYVIKQGICEILSPESHIAVGELGERNHFGMLECLLRLPAFYTIRAVTHVQVFCISRKHLTNAFKIPKINDAIEFAKNQPEYSRLQLRRARFVWYQPESPAPNLQRFRRPRKHETDAAFVEPFNKLGSFSVFRYCIPRFTIRPDGRYLVYCEWVRVTCALLSAMLFPGYTYLVLHWPWLRFVIIALDITAIADMLQRLLVGYFNEQGILVYHPSSTVAHYIRGAFLIDFLGCCGLQELFTPRFPSHRNEIDVSLMLQVTRLNRLLQLYRTPSALLGLAKYVRRDILLVINALPLFMALVNVLTCFVVLYSVEISHTADLKHYTILPIDDKGGSWIDLFSNKFRYNITESTWNLHLTAYFWVIFETTTTGYNCISPSNLQLMQVLLVGMVIGALIITYFSVRIISIRANVNKLLAAFQQDMEDMSTFMKRENLNSTLQREVLDYYTNDWEKMGGTDYRNVLKLCDQVTLRSDTILNIFGSTFVKCPILTQCDESLLRTLGRAVRSYHFLTGTVVIEVDDVIRDVYIVDQGCVEVINTEDSDDQIMLGKGSIFGNIESPSTIRYPRRITATMNAHLLQIGAEVFHNIIKEFPSVTTLMNKYRPNNESYIEGMMIRTTSNFKKSSFISPMAFRYRKILKFFHFRSPLTQIYFIIISLSCIFADVYNAGFLDNRFGLIVALYVLDVAFYCKFVIQYFLPYVSDDDEDITNELLKIRKKYFKTEFKVDVLSCLPIELFCFLIENDTWLFFAWLRLNRILRIVTVYKCLMRYHQHFFINLTVTTIFSALIWFTLFIHISTCFWYFIGNLEESYKPKSSWFYNDYGGEFCQNKYICSLYFILTTFTQNGVGDILPRKQSEVMFVSILQIVSMMAYMVYVGEFSNLIQYQSFRSIGYYCQYLELQEFLKNNRVSKNLMKIVNQYTQHLWRESKGVQVPYFLQNAPNCLKLKVMSAAYLRHFTNHQVFKCCDPAFLRQLVGFLQLYFYKEGMYVVKQNEITNAMYIIHSGRVIETCENETASKDYHPGQYFGLVQGLIYDYPHTHSYQCTRKSQILTLRLEDWEYLLNHFPNSKECIYKFLTYDDSSSDNNKDKVIKRERKVTISRTGGDDSPQPKSFGQTTSSAHKSGTSLNQASDLPSALKREGKSSRSASGVNFDLHTDNLESNQAMEDKISSKEALELKPLSESINDISKLKNEAELIVLRDDTNDNDDNESVLTLGGNITANTSEVMELRKEKIEEGKKYDGESKSAIILYDNDEDTKVEKSTSSVVLQTQTVHQENKNDDKNEDAKAEDISFSVVPETQTVDQENKSDDNNKDTKAKDISSSVVPETQTVDQENKSDDNNKDTKAKDISSSVVPETQTVDQENKSDDNNKDTKAKDISSSVVPETQTVDQENKNDDNNKDTKAEDISSSVVPETQTVDQENKNVDNNEDTKADISSSIVLDTQTVNQEYKNYDQQSLKEDDDGIIADILDPTSSQESDIKIFFGGRRQSDQDKPSK